MNLARALRVSLVAALGSLALVLGLVTAPAAHAEPNFKAPYSCGERWTFQHYAGEIPHALDYVRADGGATTGSRVLASAAGTVRTLEQPSGAGHYIIVDHADGWQTFYFHLSSFSVPNGTYVGQGQEIGRAGSSGNSTGPHLHFEQRVNNVRQDIRFNGVIQPYVEGLNKVFLVSDNGCSIAPHGKIGEKWHEMGGDGSVVGRPMTGEMPARNGGIFQQFERGIIIWHPDVGAWAIHGEILEEYWATDSEAAWGFPTWDEGTGQASPSGVRGQYQYFQRGLILWTQQHKAKVIHGEILKKFETSGQEQRLGYPKEREADAAASPTGTRGKFQYFTDALILWSEPTGARVVTGEIEKLFAANGREAALGYPTSDATTTSGAIRQEFEKATLTWSATAGGVVTPK